MKRRDNGKYALIRPYSLLAAKELIVVVRIYLK